MVKKAIAKALMKRWRKHNNPPELAQPKELAYTGVWVKVSQNEVIGKSHYFI